MLFIGGNNPAADVDRFLQHGFVFFVHYVQHVKIFISGFSRSLAEFFWTYKESVCRMDFKNVFCLFVEQNCGLRDVWILWLEVQGQQREQRTWKEVRKGDAKSQKINKDDALSIYLTFFNLPCPATATATAATAATTATA